MVGSGDRKAGDTVVAVAQDLDPEALVVTGQLVKLTDILLNLSLQLSDKIIKWNIGKVLFHDAVLSGATGKWSFIIQILPKVRLGLCDG